MNSVVLAAMAVFWLARIIATIRRKRALAGADLLAENLARILAGQLSRGVGGAEAVASVSCDWTDKHTRSRLMAMRKRVELGQKAGAALQASLSKFASDSAVRRLTWLFQLVDDYGVAASVLSEFADSVTDERRNRRELRNQMMEARTTAVALPMVALVMACSLVEANHVSLLLLTTGFGVTLVAGAAAVVALGVAVVLRLTKI